MHDCFGPIVGCDSYYIDPPRVSAVTPFNSQPHKCFMFSSRHASLENNRRQLTTSTRAMGGSGGGGDDEGGFESAELLKMGYRDQQKLAKEKGVSANH